MDLAAARIGADMMETVNVPIAPLFRKATIVVNVTGVRTWRLRLWCGLQLFKLASLVMGCGVEVQR